MANLKEALSDILSRKELELLPQGYKRIGHVAVIYLPRDLADRAGVIAGKIMELSGAKTVAVGEGIEGRFREPKLRIVAGDPNTETLHTENGCRFRLDPARVMFSPGNMHERGRLVDMVAPGEVIVDMFAGVGQFSIPIAVHAKPGRIHAIELNPVAHRYLSENVRMNRVGHQVSPVLGDCSEAAPRGAADRVIMGIIHVTHRYLPLAMKVLKPEGGVIHYHETVPSDQRFQRPIDRISQAAGERRVDIIGQRVVKRYSPGIDHVVIDAKIGLSGG